MQKHKYNMGFCDYKTLNQFNTEIPDVGLTKYLYRYGRLVVTPTSSDDQPAAWLPHDAGADHHQGDQEGGDGSLSDIFQIETFWNFLIKENSSESIKISWSSTINLNCFFIQIRQHLGLNSFKPSLASFLNEVYQ